MDQDPGVDRMSHGGVQPASALSIIIRITSTLLARFVKRVCWTVILCGCAPANALIKI